jgi:hypothetical protein
MVFTNMNLQARIERYKERGFQAFEAEIIILIEESAVALSRAFPDRFVLFGGASLLLFYESPGCLATSTCWPPEEKFRPPTN